jgi:hypothetical protein
VGKGRDDLRLFRVLDLFGGGGLELLGLFDAVPWVSPFIGRAAAAVAAAAVSFLVMRWLFRFTSNLVFESRWQEWFFLFVFTKRAFASAADLDGALKLSVFQDDTAFFDFDDFVIANGDKKGSGLLKRAVKQSGAKRNDFDSIDCKLFLRLISTAAQDKTAAFSRDYDCFYEGFAGKIHGIKPFFVMTILSFEPSLFFCYVSHEINDTMGIPHFVVVPRDQLVKTAI